MWRHPLVPQHRYPILPAVYFSDLALYTGTFTWIDPAVGLNYVFLCNRVYPTRNNSKISELGIRTGVADAFYKAISRGAVAIQ